jgi:fructokinase
MRIGIDLGGTKIEGVVIDSTDVELARLRVVTPRGDYNATISAICALVRVLEEKAGARASVGIGIPGALSRMTGLVKNSNSICLIGKPFKTDLEKAMERPVRLANDADCFALSEASDGAGSSYSSVFGVILGTGVGSGIVVNGNVLQGANSIAGEWGHNPLPWPQLNEYPGDACYCGKHGCIETWLSGPAFERDYMHSVRERLKAEEIAQRAQAGDRHASEALSRYVDRLARSLAAVINILDPEVIVLGGGMSNVTALYRDVPARWTDYVFSDRVDTKLVPAKHGDASGVRGAAWLWPTGSKP